MNSTLVRYEKLKEKVIDRKASFGNLMNFIESETEWLTAQVSMFFAIFFSLFGKLIISFEKDDMKVNEG